MGVGEEYSGNDHNVMGTNRKSGKLLWLAGTLAELKRMSQKLASSESSKSLLQRGKGDL